MSTDIFFNPIWDIRMTDTSLRDGSHHKRHQFTKDEVRAIVAALDTAGVPVIEVTHGDGLGGSSFNYGFSKTPEQELIKLAAETAKESQDRVPDAARRRHQGGHQGGAEQRRLDLPDRHPLHRGRRLDPALRAGPRARPGDRRLPDDEPHHPAGEAGRAGPHHGRRRLPVRLRRRLRGRAGARGRAPTASPRWSPNSATTRRSASTATRTSASASPTAIEAVRAGAKQIDGSCRRFGAGAGNAPVEALIGVFDKIGVKTGIDFFDIADAAEEVVAPGDARRMPARPQRADHGLLRACTPASSSTPSGSPSATACPRTSCCTAPASASSSAARRTSSSTSRWRSSASRTRRPPEPDSVAAARRTE